MLDVMKMYIYISNIVTFFFHPLGVFRNDFFEQSFTNNVAFLILIAMSPLCIKFILPFMLSKVGESYEKKKAFEWVVCLMFIVPSSDFLWETLISFF